MPFSALYSPDPRFEALGSEFADQVIPATFPNLRARFWNDRAAATIGLDTLTEIERSDHFAAFAPLPANQCHALATRYHGHQFRVYNPDLGDGRGFLHAQVREAGTQRLLDLGTKGTGRTPWSRGGDGRLTLKGAVREILATAMLEAVGVSTSRSFAMYETGESLQRNDEPSPTRGAVLTRLSHSHIRFGSFQRYAALGRPDLSSRLVDFVIDLYYPQLNDAKNRPAALLDAVIGKTAELTAQWMLAGFVHGVLNTDNMNINGESFDYGPYRFLTKNDPNFIAAYFDENGIYRFGRQPEASFWNLNRLADALGLISEPEPLAEALTTFSDRYRSALVKNMVKRLGLIPRTEDSDQKLAQTAFRALAAGGDRLRWEPFFFDWFGGLTSESRAMNGRRSHLYSDAAFGDFKSILKKYQAARSISLSTDYFQRPEPEELLHHEIEIIWAKIAEDDDWSSLTAKLGALDGARSAWAFS